MSTMKENIHKLLTIDWPSWRSENSNKKKESAIKEIIVEEIIENKVKITQS